MDIIAEVRRRHFVSGESISSIARSLKISRPPVRKHLSTEVESVYNRKHQPELKLGSFRPLLEQWLEVDIKLPCVFRCKVATDSGAKLPPKPF